MSMSITTFGLITFAILFAIFLIISISFPIRFYNMFMATAFAVSMVGGILSGYIYSNTDFGKYSLLKDSKERIEQINKKIQNADELEKMYLMKKLEKEQLKYDTYYKSLFEEENVNSVSN